MANGSQSHVIGSAVKDGDDIALVRDMASGIPGGRGRRRRGGGDKAAGLYAFED